MASSSSSPFSRHVTNLTPLLRASLPSSPRYPHHQRLSLSFVSTILHQSRNTCQLHSTSLNCGLAAAIPNYSSHRVIHRNHVIKSALSAQCTVSAELGSTKSHCDNQDALLIRQSFLKSAEAMQTHLASLTKDQYNYWAQLSDKSIEAGPAYSQHQCRGKIPIQPRKCKPTLPGQRLSIGVTGPNFRVKLRRHLALKDGHISGLEERIQTLDRKNGEQLLGLWRFKRKYSQIRRQLRYEVFRLKVERSFILFLLFFF